MVPLVLVSGASGFVASHIIERLLGEGYRVRGSVRRLSENVTHLTGLPGSERLELVEADLLEPNAFHEHVKGCDYVLHTASPYTLDAKDPQRDLVDPAVQGTRSMVEACAQSPSVKRVVLTSSMAAITDEPDGDRILTESDWNDKSTLDRNPYYLSKTLAEREAWSFQEREQPRFDLVVINPFLIVGPAKTKSVNTSNQVFVDLVGGVYPGTMRLSWGFVDVRDVATAHVEAMKRPSASGRYICAAGVVSMREVVELLERWGWRSVPKLGLDCAMGDFAVRLGSYFQPRGVGSYLRTHVGRVPRFDNSKIQRELGMRFRPMDVTIRDTMNDLVRWGHVAVGAVNQDEDRR